MLSGNSEKVKEKLKILGDSRIKIIDLTNVNFGWFEIKSKSQNQKQNSLGKIEFNIEKLEKNLNNKNQVKKSPMN